MTPDGRITSEFDDVTLDRLADEEHPAGGGEDGWDDLDDGFDDGLETEADERDEDDLADLELVVLDLLGTTVLDHDAELRPVPGAEELIRHLRATGVTVALVSDSPRATQDRVLDAVGWRDLADVTLGPADAGRAAPYPDLALTALLRTGVSSVEGMVVVGDTANDIASGIAAGAGLVVGVLTGADDEQTLLDAGADAVLPSVADLPELLGIQHGLGIQEGSGIR
jgi:HAD superfamily hydrolase (TIGR01509 family)